MTKERFFAFTEGGIARAFVNAYAAVALYALTALIWLVPDRRVERHLAARGGKAD